MTVNFFDIIIIAERRVPFEAKRNPQKKELKPSEVSS
nr:MAG TPA: hypothetical protein [Caudoviricetes sp.]